MSTSPVGSQAMGSLSLELNSNSSLDECWMFHADGRRNMTAQVRALRDVNCTQKKGSTKRAGANVKIMHPLRRCVSARAASSGRCHLESHHFVTGVDCVCAPSTSSSSSNPPQREKIKNLKSARTGPHLRILRIPWIAAIFRKATLKPNFGSNSEL